MADKAREAADKELQRIEKHLAEIYSRAGRELEQKAADFLADFIRLEAQHKKDVDSGTWTQEEYDEWRKNKLLYGQKWDRLIDYAKKELANANKTAIDYINGKTTQVYADSYNHLQEVIDNSNVKGYNFELVDAETVRNLYDNDELMLPHKDLDKEKDQAWNAKAINAEILQGVLQGDSIPKIAQRMNNVATKNDVAAVRTARTMITAAENSGRQAGMNKAEEDGIEFWKMWIATSDERTRESHNVLNGQCIPNGEMFVTIDGEELEFPGDWRADGSEVYNCRCTLGTIIKGFNKKKLDEAIEKQQEQQPETEQLEENSNAKQELSEELVKFIETNFKHKLSEENYKFLIETLENNPLQSDLLSRYGGNVSAFVEDNVHAFYRPSTKALHWHTNTEPDKTTFTTLFHELGHMYDAHIDSANANYGELDKIRSLGILPDFMVDRVFENIPSSSDEFLSALRRDKDLIKSIIDSGDREKINPMVTGYTTAIQDFISGVLGSDAKYRGEVRWQHSEKYYNRRYTDQVKRFNSASELKDKFKSIGMNFKNEKEIKEYVRQFEAASELWAHMNSVNACGGEQLELMKTYCPNSYEAYLKIMEGI